jgi:type II secretory pathway component PulM
VSSQSDARPATVRRPVFGLSSVAALAISTNVEQAVVSYVQRAAPPDARLARIDAQLQAIRDQLTELTASGRDVAHLEEILAHACARIEEWTA